MESFYVAREGQQLGPFTKADIRAKVQSGEVALTDSYWSQGLAGWMPLHLLITPSILAAVPRYAGFWRRVVAALIDVLVIGLPLGALQLYYLPEPPRQVRQAPGERDIATQKFDREGHFVLVLADGSDHFADAMKLYRFKLLVIILIFAALSFVASWLYSASMESSARQATLGKMIAGLKVADLEEQRISFGTATVRFMSRYFVSSILTVLLASFFAPAP